MVAWQLPKEHHRRRRHPLEAWAYQAYRAYRAYQAYQAYRPLAAEIQDDGGGELAGGMEAVDGALGQ